MTRRRPHPQDRFDQPQIMAGTGVRHALSREDVDDLIHGRLIAARFDCCVCGHPGDAHLAPANAILWIDGPIAGRTVQYFALAHAHCAASEIRFGAPGTRPGWTTRWVWWRRRRRSRR